jgi:hypothetical protein
VENGFTPDPEGYPSSCALCFHMRRHLSKLEGFPELDPEHFDKSLEDY